MASFAKQYGIRLLTEDISVREYRKLLAGIMHDTPLGYVISVRSEKDPKKIREMTNAEKDIRRKWQRFRAAKAESVQYTMTLEQFQQLFKNLAGG
nr:MAG TPA: hypothetical protein [Caudoviricetes sp.]